MTGQVVIVMGSKSDLDYVKQIGEELDRFGVKHTMRVASAHKSVHHVLEVLSEYEESESPLVYIAVAGRSNALAGMIDANTKHPVVTSPPVSSAFGGADIFSSLRMPSGVAPMIVLDPKTAALAACKILAINDNALAERIVAYHNEMVQQLVDDDKSLNG
jgi:5-(carboxyamino)imidazole ribonucleotide mutase